MVKLRYLAAALVVFFFQAANNRAKIRPRGFTIHAGFVERRCCVKGRVHLGAVGQQHFHTLYATRGTGVAERSAAIDIPGIHLRGRKKMLGTPRLLCGSTLLPVFSPLLTLEIVTSFNSRNSLDSGKSRLLLPATWLALFPSLSGHRCTLMPQV